MLKMLIIQNRERNHSHPTNESILYLRSLLGMNFEPPANYAEDKRP